MASIVPSRRLRTQPRMLGRRASTIDFRSPPERRATGQALELLDLPNGPVRSSADRALHYTRLQAGAAIEGTPVQHVFIGSCTNGRIEDLRAATSIVRGRHVAKGVRAMVVPGSGAVKVAAEAEGLDLVFAAAGFEWRNAGCSFDAQGRARSDFVLNRPTHAAASILVAGANFGCGSSREHAVWGLQQFGIRAVVAPTFAEIFYSDAMNNRLLLVTLPRGLIAKLMDDADDPAGSTIQIDITGQTLHSRSVQAGFELMPRHRRMFLEGLDNIGLSLTYRDQIDAFAQGHWARQPWLRDVAALTKQRL